MVKMEISRICYKARVSKGVYEGVPLGIFGNVNAGKSSMVNFLGGREVSIVTGVKGTTRDVVGVGVEIGGERVQVLDTAGFREGQVGEVERIGIGKSWKVFEEAKVGVFVVSFEDLRWGGGGFELDAGSSNYKFLLENLERFGGDSRVIILVNKIDLLLKASPKSSIGPLISQLRSDQLPSIEFSNPHGEKVSIPVGAVTSFVDRDSWLLGNGDDSLEMTVNGFLGECQSKVLGLIERRLESVGTGDQEGADRDGDLFVANSRQLMELENCLGNLKEFERCLGMDPDEMDWSAVDVEKIGEGGREVKFDVGIQILRDAIRNLGAILGKGLMEEEILDKIFDNFCIGK